MYRQLISLFALGCCFFGKIVFAVEPKPIQPPCYPYQAIYTLHWHGLTVGTSTHTIHRVNADLLSAEAISKPLFSFLPFHANEKSYFRAHEGQIQPLQYTYHIQEKQKKKQGEIRFSWQKNEVIKQDLNKPIAIEALPHHALDKITLYFQLRKDLIQGKKTFDYTVIEPHKTNAYTFKIIGEEMLTTKIGTVKTLKLEHLSTTKERLTTLWLAKDLDYLIVKLEQKKKGKIIGDSTLKSYTKF